VALTLAPSGTGTLVTIEETAVSGPGALIPGPLENAMITWRNNETLLRLAFIAENRRLP
jgi:hypothetical protein